MDNLKLQLSTSNWITNSQFNVRDDLTWDQAQLGFDFTKIGNNSYDCAFSKFPFFRNVKVYQALIWTVLLLVTFYNNANHLSYFKTNKIALQHPSGLFVQSFTRTFGATIDESGIFSQSTIAFLMRRFLNTDAAYYLRQFIFYSDSSRSKNQLEVESTSSQCTYKHEKSITTRWFSERRMRFLSSTLLRATSLAQKIYRVWFYLIDAHL